VGDHTHPVQAGLGVNHEQDAEKHPSAALLSSFIVAAYLQVRLTPQDFGSSRRRDFAKPNLHLPARRSLGAGRGIFEHPGKNLFFSSLVEFTGIE